jgi:hypothetical protein
MRTSRWGLASMGSVAVVATSVFFVTANPSRAAVTTSAFSAPYASADHSVERSCSGPVQQCSAAAAANAHTGNISVSALADSGLGGSVPGSAASAASGELSQVVNIAPATAATFTFHVHVTRVASSWSDAGRSDFHVWSTAACDGCPPPYEQDAFPDHPGDLTLAVTLVRGVNGGSTATLNLGGYADARIGCDDFCVLPRGTGRALGDVTLTGVDVKLWGLGTPATPVISVPALGSRVAPGTFETNCDPGCQTVQGEKFSGTSEPGMLVKVLDGSTVVGQTLADANGVWSVFGSLPAGPHTLSAEASGPQGEAWSTARSFSVTG